MNKLFTLTFSANISFSCNFEFRISFVIFSFNSSKSSGLKLVVFDPLNLLAPRSPPVELLRFSGESDPPLLFGGSEINPLAPRLRSVSRISMKVCENLEKSEYLC